jgi:hypothetical protein
MPELEKDQRTKMESSMRDPTPEFGIPGGLVKNMDSALRRVLVA